MTTTVWDRQNHEWVDRPTRWGMWWFVAVQIVMGFVLILSVVYAATSTRNSCGLDNQTCNDITGWGAMLVFGIVLAVWAAIDIIIGMTFIVVHLSSKVWNG